MKRAGVLAAFLLCGCQHPIAPKAEASVRVPDGVAWADRTFHSRALGRDATYRVISPKVFRADERVRVVYLLHGNGNSYREWSQSSPIAQLALQNFVLIMPEGHSTYFLNAVTPAGDRYEDFVTQDLVADAERNLGQISRSERSIVGVSMGGYAALVLAMPHPLEYGLAGALSPPVDAAQRGFSVRRWGQWMGFRRIFGPAASEHRAANDPFALVHRADPRQIPSIFLSVGAEEPLRGPVERFDRALRSRGVPHIFRERPGGHNWTQWALEMPDLLSAVAGPVAMSH